MSDQGRVFLILDPTNKFSIDSVLRYGEPVFVLMDYTNPLNPSLFFREVEMNLRSLRYDPDIDWVAMTGPILPVALFTAKLTAMYPNGFKSLLFNANEGQYIDRKMNANSTSWEREEHGQPDR